MPHKFNIKSKVLRNIQAMTTTFALHIVVLGKGEKERGDFFGTPFWKHPHVRKVTKSDLSRPKSCLLFLEAASQSSFFTENFFFFKQTTTKHEGKSWMRFFGFFAYQSLTLENFFPLNRHAQLHPLVFSSFPTKGVSMTREASNFVPKRLLLLIHCFQEESQSIEFFFFPFFAAVAQKEMEEGNFSSISASFFVCLLKRDKTENGKNLFFNIMAIEKFLHFAPFLHF